MSLIAGVTAAASSAIIIPSPAKRGGSGWGPRPHHSSLLLSLTLAALLLGPITAQAQTAPPKPLQPRPRHPRQTRSSPRWTASRFI